METELEVVLLIVQLDRGYHNMVTDNEKWWQTHPYILTTDKKISNIQEILPLLKAFFKANCPLLITLISMARLFQTLVLNKIRGTFNVAVTPGFEIAAVGVRGHCHDRWYSRCQTIWFWN